MDVVVIVICYYYSRSKGDRVKRSIRFIMIFFFGGNEELGE